MDASRYGTLSCKSCITSLLLFWKRSQPLRAIALLEGSQGRVRRAQAKELWSVVLLPAHACVTVLIQSFKHCRHICHDNGAGLGADGNGLMTTGESVLQKQWMVQQSFRQTAVCTNTCCTHTLIPSGGTMGRTKTTQIPLNPWAARYNTWLLSKPKGVVFSFSILSDTQPYCL